MSKKPKVNKSTAKPQPQRKPGRPPKERIEGEPALQRQTVYLQSDEWERVREAAFVGRTNCSNIVRQALRAFFKMSAKPGAPGAKRKPPR